MYASLLFDRLCRERLQLGTAQNVYASADSERRCAARWRGSPADGAGGQNAVSLRASSPTWLWSVCTLWLRGLERALWKVSREPRGVLVRRGPAGASVDPGIPIALPSRVPRGRTGDGFGTSPRSEGTLRSGALSPGSPAGPPRRRLGTLLFSISGLIPPTCRRSQHCRVSSVTRVRRAPRIRGPFIASRRASDEFCPVNARPGPALRWSRWKTETRRATGALLLGRRGAAADVADSVPSHGGQAVSGTPSGDEVAKTASKHNSLVGQTRHSFLVAIRFRLISARPRIDSGEG